MACLTLTPDAQAQSEGFALNRYEPAEHGSDWFATESLDLRGHNRWTIGLMADWAHKPLVAYDGNGNELASVVENQFIGHFGANVVLWERLRLGLNLPILVAQGGETVDFGGQTFEAASAPAFGDVRLGADLRLLGEYRDALTLALGARVHLPSGDRDAFMSDDSVRVTPRVMVAGDIEWFTYSANTGVNFRMEGQDFAGAPFGHEWTFAAAAGVRLLDERLTIGPEIWGSTVIDDDGSGFFEERSTPFEGAIGAHYQHENWLFGLGFGPGFTQGLGSPQNRLLVSLAYHPEPHEPAPPPPDSDGDGIIDSEDACPKLAGEPSDDPKKNGCPPPPDSDGDGIIDSEDACPNQAGPASDDPDKNGCPPPPDSDGDGIIDSEDACPNQAGPASDDPDENGCPPPPDTDGDGIIDSEDACPDTAGEPSDNPKRHGCPKAKIEGGQVKILERIEFDTGKATIREESLGVLRAVSNILKTHPEIEKLLIEGHTDNRGSEWLNNKLSRERAKSVLDWLVEDGIAADRLSSKGFGPSRPIDDNQTEEGRQNNRRVEFHIQKTSAPAEPTASSPSKNASEGDE